ERQGLRRREIAERPWLQSSKLSTPSLGHLHNRVHPGPHPTLPAPSRPSHNQTVGNTVPQSEVQNPTRLREVPSRRIHLPHHFGTANPKPRHRTNRIAVATGPRQLHLEIIAPRKSIREKVRA